MGLQIVLFLLAYACLPVALGVLHLLHLRPLWGILFSVSGLLTAAVFMGWFHMVKTGFAAWMAFIAILAISVYRRMPLQKNERMGHAILGTASLCFSAVLFCDVFDLKITGLSDDSTGLIVGIALSALLFRSRSRRR